MKRLVLGLGVLILTSTAGWSQEPNAAGTNSIAPNNSITTTNTVSSSSSLGLLVPPEAIGPRAPSGKATVGGAVVQLFRSELPLQMISPFAPGSYGDGTAFRSINPVTGEPDEGVTLLLIRLPTGTKGKKASPKADVRPVSVPPKPSP